LLNSKEKKQPIRVIEFIRRAEGFAPIQHFLRTPSARSTKDILTRLSTIEATAAEMLSALSALCDSDGFDRLIISGRALGQWAAPEAQSEAQPEKTHEIQMQILASESAEMGHIHDLALMWGGQELMLRRLWSYSRALQLHAHHARLDLKPSKGTRSDDQHALALANYLYESWFLVFNERPSKQRDGDFHSVAMAVGDVFGLPIGGKTLKAVRPRT
jgi:hypothetical protein